MASAPKKTKIDESARELNRRQKRLDFLLKQTEVFSKFFASTGEKPDDESMIDCNSNDLVKTTKQKPMPNSRQRKTTFKSDDGRMQSIEMDVKPSFFFEETPPFIVGGEMRDYQIRGLNWMITLNDNGINGILADEMGLGKTLQTISLLGFLSHHKNISGPHIVIAPKSTLNNWMKEFKHWCPSLRTICLIGDIAERKSLKNTIADATKFDVVVTSYEMCVIEQTLLRRHEWQYLIIDEGHRIKNERTVLAQVVRSLWSENRLLLTGTPLQNNLHELWALLNFLLPDIFNRADDFDMWFDMDKCFDDTSLVQRLHGILRPFLLRRIKSEVEKTLKPKIESRIFVGMSKMQKDWYRRVLLRDIQVISPMGTINNMRISNIFMHLRKCTMHPYLFEGAEPGPPYFEGEHIVKNSGKMSVLDKLLSKLKKQGSRVLIFSQMTKMLDILEDYCIWRNHDFTRLDGQTKHVDRDQYISEFNAPGSEKFLFLLSTRAGGLGINLTSADVVIIFDSDWNPQMDLQAIDRAHRIGQKKQVRVFRLITDNTVDVKMHERASMKLRLDRLVIQQGRLINQNANLDAKSMMEMIKFGSEYILNSKKGDVLDEDIDKILKDSEEKSAILEKHVEEMVNSAMKQEK